MNKITTAAFAAVALAATASPAMAADVNLDPLNCSAGNQTCTKSFNHTVTTAGPINQGFTFTLPLNGKFGGSITTEFTDPSQNIDFTSILIDGIHKYTKDVGDPAERWVIKNLVLTGGPHRIDVVGTANGLSEFAGTISFAAVPEPATWGLMILGFGLVGSAMRRRQKVSVRYA